MRLVTTDGATCSSRATLEKLRSRATRRNAPRFSRLLTVVPPAQQHRSRLNSLYLRKLITLCAAFCPAGFNVTFFYYPGKFHRISQYQRVDFRSPQGAFAHEDSTPWTRMVGPRPNLAAGRFHRCCDGACRAGPTGTGNRRAIVRSAGG